MAPSRSAVAAAAVPITFVLVNGLSYALLLVGARLLSKSDYGALSSLLGVLLIASIPMLALQTVAARRTAVDAGTAGLVRGTAIVGGAVAVPLAAVSPAVAAFLHLRGVAGVLLVAATVPAAAVLGTAMGVAQGRRNFARLALLIAASTGGRSATGLVALVVGRSSEATLVGIAVGMSVAAAAVAAGRVRVSHRVALRDRSRAGVLVETAQAAHAHGVFLLLTSLDVLLARHVLTSSVAGVYAVGSVVTRVTVWLPQSIVALMFASFADERSRRGSTRRAAAVVLGLGAVVVAGTLVAGSLVVSVVGGPKYHALDGSISLYALLGALLAVLQLTVLAGLARRRLAPAVLVWVTAAADVVAVLAVRRPTTPTGLVATLVVVTAVTAAAGLWLTTRDPRSTVAQPLAPEGQLPGV